MNKHEAINGDILFDQDASVAAELGFQPVRLRRQKPLLGKRKNGSVGKTA